MKFLWFLFFCSNLFANTFNQSIFKNTIESIQKNSLYKMSESEIYQAAIEGVLHKLEMKSKKKQFEDRIKDEANCLLSPRSHTELKNELQGNISGIGVGIEFDKEKGQSYPLIISVIDNGGAETAGIKKGDQILKINAKAVSSFQSFRDIVYTLRGKTNTNVKLNILRDGDVITKNVIRKEIKWDAIEVIYPEKNIPLIKLNYFNERTPKRLVSELQKFKKNNVKKIIFDLRENHGGPLDQGIDALRVFAKKGDILLKTKYLKNQKIYKAEENGIGNEFKAVIIIGPETRSMGEAFARSLKLLTNGVIVGSPSFGKASVESLIELKNGHSVKFTVAQILDSTDWSWQDTGLIPDYYVSANKDKDFALLAAKNVIKKL